MWQSMFKWVYIIIWLTKHCWCMWSWSFDVFSNNKEGLLCDLLQSKSILKNAIINNKEWGFPVIVSVVSINPQRSLPSWFVMKITYNQFTILKTWMVQLHLLRQLAVFKRNTNMLRITKYNLYHVHVQMLAEVKGKKLWKIRDRNKNIEQWNHQKDEYS